MASYFSQTCPAGVREDGDDKGNSKSHHSGDDQDYVSSSSAPRHGRIKGYGYATDRCICYTGTMLIPIWIWKSFRFDYICMISSRLFSQYFRD